MSKGVSGSVARRAAVGASFFLCLGVVVVALLLMASPAGGAAYAEGEKIGLISDVGGFDDGGFNWMAQQGLLRAESELGIDSTLYESDSSDDYEELLQLCADEGNVLCISVGFLMGDATLAAAVNNPATHFAVIDFTYDGIYPENLRGMMFAPEQAAYLAGTLVGLMTESDVAGAVGGMEIPPVQAFMEPYGNGIRCATPDATALLTYTGTFGDALLGAEVAQEQMDKGADAIFGCGGQTGNGAILHATEGGIWGVGVDTDQWITLFANGTVEGSDKLLTSVMKRVDNAVYMTVDDEVQSQFTSGTVVYDLSNDGAGLAPFHEVEPFVPESVLSRLDMVEERLLEGAIDPWQSCTWSRVHLPLVLRVWAP